jgi:dolichyl-phosphate-mannose-protein mannosyltransferase
MVALLTWRTYSREKTTAAISTPSRNFFPGLITTLYNLCNFQSLYAVVIPKWHNCNFVSGVTLPENEKNSNIHACVAFALLVLMAVLAGGAARRESVTIDEVAHTGAGVSYWQTLDMRMNEEHPPLSKLIAGLPLAIRGAHADYSHVSWTFSGGRFFNQYLGEWVFGHWFLMRWNDPRSTIRLARFPMLLMTLLLGYVIYILGCRLGGLWGGLLCLACYVATPAFLAFGPLVITDVVITLFWVLTVWLMPTLWRSPSRGGVVLFGLAFAGALLSKFSAGLLFIVFPAVALSMRLRPLPEQPTETLARRYWRRRGWWNFVKGTLWATLFVYVVYFIFSWRQSTDSFSIIPHFPASPLLRRLLMPAWIYLRGLAGFAFSAASRPTYILGHSYPHGVWFYFPVIFMLKSQLSFLLLLLLSMSIAVLWKRKRDSGEQTSVISAGMDLQWRCIWVSLVVYVTACMLNRLDLSVRHFLIAIALIILLLAPLPRLLQGMRGIYPRFAQAGMWISIALAFAGIFSAARAYPFFLPYINSLGMGKPGYLLVNDSNLDWDQAAPEVEAFARQHGVNPVLLDQYGFSVADAYIPQARPWNCQEPASTDAGKWVFVSPNNLVDSRNCLWLMQYPHEALGGGSMYAVSLPAVIPPAGQSGGPPAPKDFRFFGGGMLPFDPREVFTACIRDPAQLEPTMQRMIEIGKQQSQKRSQKH